MLKLCYGYDYSFGVNYGKCIFLIIISITMLRFIIVFSVSEDYQEIWYYESGLD